MSDPTSASAEIIPFPLRRAPPPGGDGQERLRRALLALDAAVTGQRNAVATWRRALADLGTVMAGLGESMQRYRGSLDRLGGGVATLHAQAAQLERTADAALAVSSD
jgi:ABC-type transporter Mla subunit MlaD